MASIQEIARRAGVSTATVSRAFSSPELINAKTQERVLAVARELNYRPRRSRTPRAPGPHAPIHTAIGFEFFAATPNDTLQSNPFYGPVLAGAATEAASLGLHLLLHQTERHSAARSLPRMVRERAVGGILLVGTADPDLLAAYAERVPHLLLLDHRDLSGRYDSVVSDGFGGAYAAARRLIELGHRRIGYFLGEPGVGTFEERLHGYYCALLDAGLTPDQKLVAHGNHTAESEQRLAEILRSSHRPSAVMASNDHYAFIALSTCRQAGLGVPEDVSLTGFDDVPYCAQSDPPMTTVRVDKHYMGQIAVRRLHAAFCSGRPAVPARPGVVTVAPAILVERSSCRKLDDPTWT